VNANQAVTVAAAQVSVNPVLLTLIAAAAFVAKTIFVATVKLHPEVLY
jgi:hypothetical protein